VAVETTANSMAVAGSSAIRGAGDYSQSVAGEGSQAQVKTDKIDAGTLASL